MTFQKQLGMSSSQLTNSIIFERGRAQPPTRYHHLPFIQQFSWWTPHVHGGPNLAPMESRQETRPWRWRSPDLGWSLLPSHEWNGRKVVLTIWWMVVKSCTSWKRWFIHVFPTICRVSTILLVVQDFFLPQHHMLHVQNKISYIWWYVKKRKMK